MLSDRIHRGLVSETRNVLMTGKSRSIATHIEHGGDPDDGSTLFVDVIKKSP